MARYRDADVTCGRGRSGDRFDREILAERKAGKKWLEITEAQNVRTCEDEVADSAVVTGVKDQTQSVRAKGWHAPSRC
jgi:hypothetical protein